MAANTSFKIQCPSCEAMVPIRDPNLVGKKTDCPKCKYRFVVEDPGDADDRPAAKRDGGRAKAKPKPKKKAGGNNVLILGSVLGVVALAVLGVGGYLIFGGDSTPPKSTSTPVAATSTPSANPTPSTAPTTDQAADPTATPNPDAAAVPPAAAALNPGVQTPAGEISNLLPGDTQSVISINMDRLRNSTLGQQAFESRIGFRPETFKAGFGLGVEEIARFIRAENFGQGWSFNVMKTHRPVTVADFHSVLGLQKGPKSPIRGREYFVIAPNPLLDNLSTILESELESREAKAPGKKKESAGPLTLVLLDPTTVVVSQQDAMEEFLQADAKPQLKSRVVGGGGDAAGDAATPPPEPRGGRRGGRDAQAGPGAAGGDAGGPQFADRSAYLTIDPHLKAMLDRLEGVEENMVLTMAQQLQADPKIVTRVREATGVKELDVTGMNVLGAAIHQLNVEKCKGEVGLEMFREQSAKDLEEALKKVIGPAGQALGLYLGGLRIDVEGATLDAGTGGNGSRPGVGGGPGLRGAPPDANLGVGPDGNPLPPGSTGDGPKSTMKLERKGRTLLFNVDLSLNEKAYDRVYALTEGTVIRMKGMVDMSSGSARYHELAAAAVKYRTDAVEKEKKPKDAFPRATFPRDDSIGRLSRTWPPNQRVSWMTGLLPFLGYQEVYEGIALNKSWKEEQNLKQGAVLVPAFLNPRYPRPTWRARPASLGIRDLGATHFVGVAGVGIDAADYDPTDPALVKKLGIFRYDRRTDAKDVTDGLANTVMMLQVPPTHQRAWIAGGGATVTGVPDAKSVQPFVTTQGNGKRGTYALMADGSVRFIRDDIADDVFKAMCTIKAGDEIADLNKEAQKVDPKGPSLKTSETTTGGQ